jgi:phage terminase small subunit
MKLTAKQKRFVEEYLVDLNATQAAIRAGYSPKTANEIGAENLAKPSIRLLIEEYQRKRSERLEVTQDAVMRDLTDLCNQAAKAGQYTAAVKAKELQGKHLGMFVDKIQHSGDPKAPLQSVVEVVFKKPDVHD